MHDCAMAVDSWFHDNGECITNAFVGMPLKYVQPTHLFLLLHFIKFSALFAKTWRVNKIFHNPNRFKRIKVTEMDVMKPYIFMMGINLLVLSCWTAIAPLTYNRYDAVGTDDWNRVISTYGICTSESESKATDDFWPFLGVILVINISLLVIANVQGYKARSIQTEYSESRYIIVIMTSMIQMFTLAVPCISLLSKQPRPYFIVMIIVIFCVSSAVLGFMFWPKILHTRLWIIEQAEKERIKAEKKKKNSEIISKTTDNGNDGLKVAAIGPAKFVILKASCELPDAKKRETDYSLNKNETNYTQCKEDNIEEEKQEEEEEEEKEKEKIADADNNYLSNEVNIIMNKIDSNLSMITKLQEENVALSISIKDRSSSTVGVES